jgi:hypothetical protein
MDEFWPSDVDKKSLPRPVGARAWSLGLQLALDPDHAPAAVVPCHLQDQGDQVGIERWSSGPSMAERPRAGDELPVPAEDRRRGDDEPGPADPRSHPREGRDLHPVPAPQPGPRVGSLQDRELMAKDEDLSLALGLVTVRSDPENQPEDEVADREEHRRMMQSPTSGDRNDGFRSLHPRIESHPPNVASIQPAGRRRPSLLQGSPGLAARQTVRQARSSMIESRLCGASPWRAMGHHPGAPPPRGRPSPRRRAGLPGRHRSGRRAQRSPSWARASMNAACSSQPSCSRRPRDASQFGPETCVSVKNGTDPSLPLARARYSRRPRETPIIEPLTSVLKPGQVRSRGGKSIEGP